MELHFQTAILQKIKDQVQLDFRIPNILFHQRQNNPGKKYILNIA